MQTILPPVIILLGPPGAGKGTHASPLSHHLGIPHISTGELFREQIRLKTSLGIQAKEYIDRGQLVPDALVLDMIFDRVSHSDCRQGYILDGFPRTLPQAMTLDLRLKMTNRVIVLNFHLSDEQLIERITGRMSCKECARPYHKAFDPPQKEMICDSCKSPLYIREDDREEIIRKRLEVYHQQTEPLITYYMNQKEVFHEIDAEKSKAAVFADILEEIPLMPSLK